MLRDLPAHSRLSASTFDPESLYSEEEKGSRGGKGKKKEVNSEDINWFQERRVWDRPEMQVMALQANLLRDLVIYVPRWKKNQAPDHDPVGPPEWRHPELTEKPKGPASVMDVMQQVFGYQGDVQEVPTGPSVSDVMRQAFGYQGDAS